MSEQRIRPTGVLPPVQVGTDSHRAGAAVHCYTRAGGDCAQIHPDWAASTGDPLPALPLLQCVGGAGCGSSGCCQGRGDGRCRERQALSKPSSMVQ